MITPRRLRSHPSSLPIIKSPLCLFLRQRGGVPNGTTPCWFEEGYGAINHKQGSPGWLLKIFKAHVCLSHCPFPPPPHIVHWPCGSAGHKWIARLYHNPALWGSGGHGLFKTPHVSSRTGWGKAHGGLKDHRLTSGTLSRRTEKKISRQFGIPCFEFLNFPFHSAKKPRSKQLKDERSNCPGWRIRRA